MVLIVKEDGGGESALAQAVAQHRAGFCADYDLQGGADFADTAPPPAEACTEIGADLPRKRKASGVYFAVAFAAALCSVMLAAHFAAQPAPKPARPANLGVMA
jgi:hypothetical protein